MVRKKMKQDLTTGTWQDDTGCPISIILVRSEFVCRSVIPMDIVAMHVWMSISWVFKYSLAKAGEPTGEPRRRKPVVSSTGRGGPIISTLFSLVECLEMASEIVVASVGLIWWKSGTIR